MLLKVEPPRDTKLLAYITIIIHVVTSLITSEQLGCCNSVNSIVIIIIIYINFNFRNDPQSFLCPAYKVEGI